MNSAIKDLPKIIEIINKYDLNTKKTLGQNFIHDLNITDKIARFAGNLQDSIVMEIGPGVGSLTRSILLRDAKRVIAIEKDRRCYDILNDYLVPVSNNRLEIINYDALRFTSYRDYSEKIIIIANLPYNIATELLLNWLEDISCFDFFILMFQKEVADRILAQPNTKGYGRLAVKVQFLCEVSHLFDLQPEVFFPKPKVTSSVILIKPRKSPFMDGVETASLEKICRIVFNQRRKIINSTLKKISDNPEKLLNEIGIKPSRRPDSLTLEEFCLLAKVFK